MAYTRLTVAGTNRKANLVLPDDEPVGALLPQLLDVLGEKVPGGKEVALTTLTGVRIDLAETLSDQQVAHGTMIQLTPIDDAPQPPEVVDITDAVAIVGGQHRDRWNHRARATIVAVLTALASLLIPDGLRPYLTTVSIVDPLAGGPLLLAAALSCVGAYLARRNATGPAAVFAAAAFGLAAPQVPLLTGSWSPSTQVVLVAGVAWTVIGVVVGLGARRRSALVGSGFGLLAAALFAAGAQLVWPALPMAVVTALTGLVLIGLLPGAALTFSGLTGYDDQTMRGERPQRGDVDSSILEGYATLTWLVAAIGLPTALALVSLMLTANGWALALGCVIAFIMLLRTRLLPLVLQRVVLWVAGVLPLFLGLVSAPGLAAPQRSLIAAALVVVLLAVALATPSDVVSARLRRAADVAELLLVIATIPLTLGALNVYTDLLETFR
ncbi:MAG: EsaB/YukD family protein [Propionibacteriaceae bacterium]|nr:EsaB/YukD family protein [Propionibacteriaceae bacterium]